MLSFSVCTRRRKPLYYGLTPMVASLNLNNSKSRVHVDTAYNRISYFLSNVGSVTLEALVLWFQQLGKNDVEIVVVKTPLWVK